MNIRIVVAALLMLLGSSVYAELKIAIVDQQLAMQKSQEFTRARMEAEEDLKDERDKIKDLEFRMKEIQEKLQKENLTLSDQKKLKLSQEQEALYLEYQNVGKLATKQLRERLGLVMNELAPKVREAVERVRKEKAIDLIITAEAVVSVSPESALDITAEVTEKMNSL